MSVFRYPQLAHWGAFTAVVEADRLLRCEPFHGDPNPSPMLDSIVPMVYSDLRIRKPAVRRSWLKRREASDGQLRGREDFVEVEWDLALDLVAEQIERVRGQYGPSGLFCGSYGWSSAGRLHHARSLIRRFYFAGGGGVDQTGNYSWGTAQFLLPHIIGTYAPLTGRVTSWPSIIKNTDIFVAFGGLALKNGQVSSGGAAEHTQESWLRKLAGSGTRVVNISPLREDCPEFLAADWIPIRPNTDVAFMLALAYEIERRGCVDRSFVHKYCVGYEVLRDYVLGKADGVAKTPEWAGRITGVPAQRIAELAESLCGARSYLTCSFAVQRAQHGEQPYWMVIALAAMLGQIGLAGGGFGFGHGSMNGVGNPRVATPGPAMPVGKNPADLEIPVARITDMLLNPGAPYSFQGSVKHYPDVQLIHWAGGNPFHHHQDLNRFLQAWRTKPQAIIVQDIWWTPAAQHADIVLPICTSLERNDIGGSSRDRYVLAMHRAISPLAHARNDLDVFTELSERLGYRDAYTEHCDEMDWIKRIYGAFCADQQKADIRLPDFDSFWEQGHVQLPTPDRDFVLFEDFRKDPIGRPLRTPSGKIELYSHTLAEFGCTDCGPHAKWIPPDEWLGAGLVSRFPLHLVSIQPSDRLHSQLDAAPLAQRHKIAGCEAIAMHPDDARARGLAQGERVRVFNDRGACLAGLRLTAQLMKGVVVMSTGAWFRPGESAQSPECSGTANVLTRDIGTSSLTQGPNAMSCLVQVEAWAEAAAIMESVPVQGNH